MASQYIIDYQCIIASLSLNELRIPPYLCHTCIFTRGQFRPSGIVIACVCVSVRLSMCLCVCINHLLVRTITHQPFTLESPNLDERRKTPWLRCLLFLGVIDLDLQGQIKLESRILPHFELVCTIVYCFGGWLTLIFNVKFNLQIQIYPILSLSIQ